MLIGFVGNKCVGKDTASDFICQKYNGTKLAFADPLKNAVEQLFTLSDSQLEDVVLKETIDSYWGVSPRELLEFLGTDLLRDEMTKLLPSVGDNIFVKCLERRLSNQHDLVCVSDVRFPNEALFIKEKGGILIKISKEAPDSTNIDNHLSESYTKEIEADFEIVNSGSLDEFLEAIDECYETNCC